MMKLTPKKIDLMIELIEPKDYVKYIHNLSKTVNITYSSCVSMIKELIYYDFVILKKTGRIKIIIPTKEGKELFEYLLKAKNCLRCANDRHR
jgi:predicted transcriptional regulator